MQHLPDASTVSRMLENMALAEPLGDVNCTIDDEDLPDEDSLPLAYTTYNFELHRFERKVEGLRQCHPVEQYRYSQGRRRPPARRPPNRWQRGHHRWAPRSQRTARRATKTSPSRAGPDPDDGDPEPPPWRAQCWTQFEYKRYEEHRTAHYMSGCQKGGRVGCPS